MNLYRVYNGYTGFDAVHVLVSARDDIEALSLARQVFSRQEPQNPSYSAKLEAELVLTDLTQAQCSEVVG